MCREVNRNDFNSIKLHANVFENQKLHKTATSKTAFHIYLEKIKMCPQLNVVMSMHATEKIHDAHQVYFMRSTLQLDYQKFNLHHLPNIPVHLFIF